MEVKGTIQLFVSKRGDKIFYTASIGRKNQDGTYQHANIDVEFGKENFPAEKLAKLEETKAYTLEVKSGFLSAVNYNKADGTLVKKVVIHVIDATITKSTEIKKNPANLSK